MIQAGPEIKQELKKLLNELKGYSECPITEIIEVVENRENMLVGWVGMYDLVVTNRNKEPFVIILRYGYGSEILLQDHIDFIYSSSFLKNKVSSYAKRHIIYFCEFDLSDQFKNKVLFTSKEFLPAGVMVQRFLTDTECLSGYDKIAIPEFIRHKGYSSGSDRKRRTNDTRINEKGFFYDNEPLISVIIPAFNSSATICQTIQSVINQSYTNIELIIIDGGSTDNTLGVIEKYKDYIDIFVSEKDKGIFDALNKGTHLSTGIYSVFIGSDDLIFCDTIEKVAGVIQNNSFPDFIYGDIFVLKLNGSIIEKHSFIRSKKYGEFSVFHPSLFISKKVFEEFGGFDLRYKGTADADFELKLITNKKTGIKVDHYFSLFREGGLTFLYKNKYTEAFEIFKKNNALSFKFLTNYLKFNVYRLASIFLRLTKQRY